MTSEHFASSSRVVNLIRSTMALALFRTESDQRINCPIRTNTQRFCLARAVHYQPAPHHPGTRQEPWACGWMENGLNACQGGSGWLNGCEGGQAAAIRRSEVKRLDRGLAGQ